jgi:hypothetical protein
MEAVRQEEGRTSSRYNVFYYGDPAIVASNDMPGNDTVVVCDVSLMSPSRTQKATGFVHPTPTGIYTETVGSPKFS